MTDSEPRTDGPRIAPSAQVHPTAYVGDRVAVEDGVVIGPGAVLLGPAGDNEPVTLVARGAGIGANATVLAGVTIGMRARVLPGAVVGRSVPPLAIVEGNPARISGYVETLDRRQADERARPPGLPGVQRSRVGGVTLHWFRRAQDLRGSLTVGEFEREIPFCPKRYFLVFDVPTAETRGEHAHRRCEQFLVAVRGSLNVVVDDSLVREEFVLDCADRGLYLPAMTWGIQYKYTADAVLLVFASDYYDPADYVRDYSDFLALAAHRHQP